MMMRKHFFGLFKWMRILLTAWNPPQGSNQILNAGRMHERKYRFTASRFQLIGNHDNFEGELINLKPFSSIHVEHGMKYEPIAL